ncbi:MAG: SpoIIE family protein phosphatase [Prevotella sp.]|nr:SpoIIE family protein phosphatase [Prevotella sp.]
MNNKKEKKKKMRSFANRLTWWIVLMMLLAMGLAAWLIYEAATELVKEEEYSVHKAYQDTNIQEIRRIISDVYLGASNHVPEIEESLGNPDRLHTLMERVVEQNTRIHSCGLSFVADYYPQKGHWFCPYAVRRDSAHIETMTIGDATHDYLKAEWFIEALEKNEPYWSKPFFDSTDSITPLVSYLIPIHDKKGRIAAVLGADLSLEWLSEKMEKADWEIYGKEWGGVQQEEAKTRKVNSEKKLERKPYSFIITGDGTYLVHPDKERVIHKNFLSYANESPDTADNHVAYMMMAGEKGSFGMEEYDSDYATTMDLEGKEVYVFFAPIKYTDWSLATVVPSFNIDIIALAVGIVLMFLIALGLLVSFLVSRFVIRRATKPLKQLALTAEEVAKGNFNTQLPVIKHHDEVGLLRDSFDDMQQSLTKYVDELKHTTASKAAMENELQVAHDIQMGMLPKIFPPYPERDDIDIFGSLTPAKEVGGDLFDFYIRDNKMCFCIGDVSGKGVPASLLMAVTRSLFRNISAHTSAPDQIVSTLNEALAEGNETNMFATAFVGVLDLETGVLHYCNAGHDAPILIGRGVGLLPCDSNVPLGVVSGWEFTAQKADIDSKTTIFLYTDGLSEAEDASHVQFGTDRITALAERLLNEDRDMPEVIVNEMIVAVHAFVGKAEQSDDLTMLAIKYLKTGLSR